MRLELTAAQLDLITRHVEAAYPLEGCGIILGRVEADRRVSVEVRLTANDRETQAKHNRYTIPPEDLLQAELRAEELGLQVIGYFHSHPDHPAEPSEFDREHAWPWYSYAITEVRQGWAVMTRSWKLRDDRTTFEEEQLDISE